MKLGHFIRKTSKDPVIDGLGHISKYLLPHQRLISESNPLKKNGIKALGKHRNITNSFTIKEKEFKTYLAASSLAHVLDGWMYLSNSFNALINGDEGTAIHLAYYAELRGAMSLLASEGIGVFDKHHFGTFKNESVIFRYPRNEMRKGATHQFVWTAMEKWSSSGVKPDSNILKIFKVNGINFYDITEYFHPSTSSSSLLSVSIIKSWLKDWCFDIMTYKSDRKERNEVSYRPQRISDFSQKINFKDIINELENYWSVISPSGIDNFSTLDKYLLRKLFESLYNNISTSSSRRDLIENAFTEHGINDQNLFNFLDFNAPYNNEHIIFQNANIKNTTSLSILARATLLLRISIGLVSQIYKSGGVHKSELNFVWDQYAVDNGFWSPGNLYPNFNDLWTDVQSSIDDLKLDVNDGSISNDIFSIKRSRPQEIIHFGQINRACLWGLDF
ncbi:hypothetical protein [Chryseobacterium lacus]|uniref:hypothetical protein n=1 Tax=Chryseobacterium lacus TaxID=2058346 RepID=UPI000F868AD8|nr:hypothetical protein [Chryseobacterium lacus]RST26323.1 hypothetical protein EIZ46_06720 [Chryseobacterium lacus]